MPNNTATFGAISRSLAVEREDDTAVHRYFFCKKSSRKQVDPIASESDDGEFLNFLTVAAHDSCGLLLFMKLQKL